MRRTSSVRSVWWRVRTKGKPSAVESPPTLNRSTVRRLLKAFDLRTLFVEELGWDHGGVATVAHMDDKTFRLEAIAQKRGFVAYLPKAA